MGWKTCLLVVVIFFLCILAIGVYSETKSEHYKYQVTTAQNILQETCKGLYPSHLQGMEEEDIRRHPDFKQYQHCLQMTAKNLAN